MSSYIGTDILVYVSVTVNSYGTDILVIQCVDTNIGIKKPKGGGTPLKNNDD